MNRRTFLHSAAALPVARAIGGTLAVFGCAQVALAAAPAGAGYNRVLILVELKGGNDGLNTLVPFTDPVYYSLRPKIAIKRDDVVQLSDRAGLHPSLAPLLPLWRESQLAILQGVGYPEPNLSHFRSIEIWDTASNSAEYLQDGWLTRAFAARPAPRGFAADGVIIGSGDLGPLAGGGTRAIALANTEQFLRRAKLAQPTAIAGNAALAHVLKVESDIVQAAAHLDARYKFRTEFPPGNFGNAIHTAAQVIANPSGVAVVRVTLTGFDTHSNQAGTQARLLKDVAAGLVALKGALAELDTVERCPGAHLCRVRASAEGEYFGRHRPRHGKCPVRARRARSGWHVRCASGTVAPVRRRQSALRARLPQRVCGDSRQLVGSGFARGARWTICRGPVPQVLTQGLQAPAFHAVMNSRQCCAPDAAMRSRASAISFAYSPALNSPRIRRKRW